MKIKEIIYDTLLQDGKWWPVNHNPSSASFKYEDGKVVGKDLLSLYYKWNQVPPSNPIKPSALFLFKLGDGVHSEFAKILARAKIKSQSETKFEPAKIEGLTKKIGFRPDILCEIDGNLEVIEVKSSKDDAMFNWKNISIQTLGPKPDHMLQVICYLNLIPGLKRGRLIYISRDSGEMLEYIIERSGDNYLIDGKPTALTFKGIVARWAQLEKHLATQTPPKPEFRVWFNDEGKVQPLKQIKGEKFKSEWQAVYSDYFDQIYLNPQNRNDVSFNYLLDTQGIDAVKKHYGLDA